jgi:uncharacterized membrane protein YeaQ/YmgE (transglycosylase-associated protein family)
MFARGIPWPRGLTGLFVTSLVVLLGSGCQGRWWGRPPGATPYPSPIQVEVWLLKGAFYVIVGAIVGALARAILAIMPGDAPGGPIVTIIMGIVGTIVGGWLMRHIGPGPSPWYWIWYLTSGVVCAVILLVIYRAAGDGHS